MNSLPNNKFLDWFTIKAFADDKLNVAENLKFVFGRVENIVGIGEKKMHFLLFSQCFNSLPNDKILDVTKLKAFADDKLNIVKTMISLYNREENTVEKGENVGYQHFLLFEQCFPKPSSSGSLKVGIVW